MTLEQIANRLDDAVNALERIALVLEHVCGDGKVFVVLAEDRRVSPR